MVFSEGGDRPLRSDCSSTFLPKWQEPVCALWGYAFTSCQFHTPLLVTMETVICFILIYLKHLTLIFSFQLNTHFLLIYAPLSCICVTCPCFVQLCTCMLWSEWSIAQSHVLCKTYCMMTTSTANRLGGNCWRVSTNRESSKIIRAQKGSDTMETAHGVFGEYRTLVEPYASVFFPPGCIGWVHLFRPG